jgi:restriction system protein
MPDITRRRNGEFLRKIFEILLDHPEGVRARDVISQIAASIKLSEYEQSEYESGGKRYDKIIRFATVDCVKAGWMVKNKGTWLLTDDGKKAYATYKDPEDFAKKALALYNVWRKSQPLTEPVLTNDTEEQTEEKEVSVTFEEAEEQAWNEIASYLHAMPPYDFQELVASLIKAMGYHVAWIAPPGKDGGIDVVAWSDPLGTKTPRIKVQVKRQVQKIAVDGLRAFMSQIGEDDVGLFVSIGGFTRDATDEARTQAKRQVTLIDLERLFDLWVDFYEKIDDAGKRRLPLRPIHFLAPQD